MQKSGEDNKITGEDEIWDNQTQEREEKDKAITRSSTEKIDTQENIVRNTVCRHEQEKTYRSKGIFLNYKNDIEHKADLIYV